MNRYAIVDDMTPEAFSAFMDAAPLVAITAGVLADLARHLGSPDAAGHFLVDEATRCQKPIAVNMEIGGGRSQTKLLAPEGWTVERLMGWAATKKDSLEQAFGNIDSIVRSD